MRFSTGASIPKSGSLAERKQNGPGVARMTTKKLRSPPPPVRPIETSGRRQRTASIFRPSIAGAISLVNKWSRK